MNVPPSTTSSPQWSIAFEFLSESAQVITPVPTLSLMVNLSEKTTHQLENPLQENSPISILISFNEVLSPFTHYDGFDYSKVIDFGMKLNDNYSDYETQIPLSFTINNTNEEYYISRLPISYDQETNIYTFEEEPFSK